MTKQNNTMTIIPDVQKLAREMTSKSQVRIMIDKVLKLSPVKWIPLGLRNLPLALHIIKKDFASGIKLLCELEVLSSSKDHYVLHNQFVDMAIANKNHKVCVYFFSLAKTYSFKPGIITYNLGDCITYLSYIRKLPEDLIIYTPVSKKSYSMKPPFEDVEDFIKNTHIQIVNYEA